MGIFASHDNVPNIHVVCVFIIMLFSWWYLPHYLFNWTFALSLVSNVMLTSNSSAPNESYWASIFATLEQNYVSPYPKILEATETRCCKWSLLYWLSQLGYVHRHAREYPCDLEDIVAEAVLYDDEINLLFKQTCAEQ